MIRSIDDVRFLVTPFAISGAPRPVIGVDGPVQGADVCYDHHASGETVNLLAIPQTVPWPGTVATTMVDGDAAISAAVVLVRAAGEGEAVRTVWPVLYEAAHYCDHLIPSGVHPGAEQAGLGLHCWLKDRGFRSLRSAASEPVPSWQTKSRVFQDLAVALVSAIRNGEMPSDFAYLERLDAFEAEVRNAIRGVHGDITVLQPLRYVDAMATYRVIETDLVLLVGGHATGGTSYTIGVHPRAYDRIDLRPALAALAAREPGWGGRRNAGGSPLQCGSRLTVEQVIDLVRTAAQRHDGQDLPWKSPSSS